MKILIIEPDRMFALQYQQALQKVGDCVVVYDAQSAITSIDEAEPDIILLELLLGMHNGIEFLYELRSYDDLQTVPVILYTYVPYQHFTSDEALLNELGVAAYLYKPEASLEQLVVTVNRTASYAKK